ncbi:tyrosine-protein phosphatase [Mesorhizobium sp. B4-1-1]|uniref:tyrosine-protein phosphatase n=1 Tax=Mesorhizobium sp. B4-1-1 TaxID=2589890 RepID=UPI0011299745|nr:tyrosine-protein phosphatase [Mesorhizobium sp. B4-1-1]TPI18377.1 protein tyrosine phosphatase [Mesorhizobium sp. B4-1-1]
MPEGLFLTITAEKLPVSCRPHFRLPGNSEESAGEGISAHYGLDGSGTWRVRMGRLGACDHPSERYAIVEGQAYRSAQPTADEIAVYHHDQHIAAIINLRGAAPGQKWYDAELRAAKELGIRHIDFAMSARTTLTRQQSFALIALMKSAPKPLLIHCQAGSDRSGLAAALYMAAIAHTGEKKSEAQLSIRFGHVAVPIIGAYEMDQSFENIEPALGFFDS